MLSTSFSILQHGKYNTQLPLVKNDGLDPLTVLWNLKFLDKKLFFSGHVAYSLIYCISRKPTYFFSHLFKGLPLQLSVTKS